MMYPIHVGGATTTACDVGTARKRRKQVRENDNTNYNRAIPMGTVRHDNDIIMIKVRTSPDGCRILRHAADGGEFSSFRKIQLL